MKKILKNKKGFTLVELMVVVAIMGILVAVAIPVYKNVTDKAAKQTIATNCRTIDSAIMQYNTANDTALAAIANSADLQKALGTYFQSGKLPEAPKGWNVSYSYPTVNEPVVAEAYPGTDTSKKIKINANGEIKTNTSTDTTNP